MRFGGHMALSDVSIDAPAGQVTGLIGPNGAGKTTTLRSILGLVPVENGRVEVEGSAGRAARSRNPGRCDTASSTSSPCLKRRRVTKVLISVQIADGSRKASRRKGVQPPV